MNILQEGKIVSINVSLKKGEKKHFINEAIINELGIINDAHSGDWHRQISFLALESIEKMKQYINDIKPGDFAENITTSGIDYKKVKIGQKIILNDKVVLQITQIGKKCHNDGCAIQKATGNCIMPTEGIFAKVINGGKISINDKIIIYE